ncbi:LysR family transcriptional regulator [Pseudomonas simiae]|uniref:LysR substrate-binding domain-containing protein n=1 Tax=Pseudomonas TaxID=286 RepID=UPI0005D35462|nr:MULTISPECIES: LysR substrate-binding domain-containing protein [Pseudomonas]KJH75904.1 LysR family transcriptional regulator [Pseudomonas sp. ES3-33]MBJ2232606.1 LysR family transcriptional regulator [Pseudomonas simiae]MBK3446238.1 LysR family transcriptional regulator [Pseudomonas lactis]MCH4880918.1 LysR family transcriptional regulator [Pseudomonas sp. TMW22090]MDY7067438.1 Glycine cleavage system transcriptional activator [Pseudomonas extremaustralis]
MDNLPSLRALQVFDAVGRFGGIVEAARRLGISAGAVSQQMKLLEDSLGLSLTFKVGKRIRLTAAGQRYHDSCAAAFESLRIAQVEVERTKNASNLRISALPSLFSDWLAPLIYAWQSEHPDLNLFLDGSHTEPASDGYEIDFRVTYGHYALTENAVELFRDCVVPVCSPKLLRGDAPLHSPADLLNYPLLSIDWLPKFASPPSWRDWFDAQHVDHSQLRDGYRVYSLSSMAIQAAVSGQGVVLAQCSMIANSLADERLIMPFARGLPLPSPYFLVGAKDAFDKAHCRDFHRWLVSRGRDQMLINEQLLSRS